MAWPVVESDPYVHNWHISVICEHLQAVTERVEKGAPHGIPRLIINIPPRHTKSLIVSVMWPVWSWVRAPETRFMFYSYEASLSTRDSLKCRHLIKSEWFQTRWGDLFRFVDDQNEKTKFQNDRGGYRMSSSISGKGTGEGGDVLAIDDPHNMKEIHSEAKRRAVIEDWWRGSMSTRMNDPNRSAVVLVMQRGHEDDLSGHLLREEPHRWEHLCLPGRFDPKRVCVTSLGKADPRTEPGEILNPLRFDEEAMEGLRVSLGPYGYSGQIQQLPSPEEGGILKRGWWKYWEDKALPRQWDRVIASVDMNVKEGEKNDYMVAQIWGKKGPDCYLLDQIRARKDFDVTLDLLDKFFEKHPEASAKYIEEKANGAAVLSQLKKKFSGLKPVDNKIVASGKLGRVHAVVPEVSAGNVYLPSPVFYPWVEDFIEECAVFDNGTHDDQVDAMTAALLILYKKINPTPVGKPTKRGMFGKNRKRAVLRKAGMLR